MGTIANILSNLNFVPWKLRVVINPLAGVRAFRPSPEISTPTSWHHTQLLSKLPTLTKIVRCSNYYWCAFKHRK